jgi:endonuclease/exonuclease/phosphatase family metal-dependent hydrolase
MKILYLNIYKGSKEVSRFKRLIRFIKNENPDILGLSELYDWDENNFTKLEDFKKRTGYKFHVFGASENNRHICLFANKPFFNVKIYNKGFHCSAIKASFLVEERTMVCFLAHLSPYSEKARILELKKIFQNSRNKKPQIFMGDLNSLSESDAYNKKNLLKIMHQQNIAKFGKDEINFEVSAFLRQKGFYDLLK